MAARAGAEAVVQVAAQAAAFLLAGLDQVLARLLHLAGQPRRRQRDRQVPRQVGQDGQVGAGQRLPRRARRRSPARLRAARSPSAGAVRLRPPSGRSRRRSHRRPTPPRPRAAAGSRRPSRPPRRAARVGSAAASSRTPQLVERRGGSPRCPNSHRPTAFCSAARSGANATATTAVATSVSVEAISGVGGGDDAEIDRQQQAREEGVDDGPAEQHLDVEQPIAEDRDRRRDRDQRQRDGQQRHAERRLGRELRVDRPRRPRAPPRRRTRAAAAGGRAAIRWPGRPPR